MSKARQLADLGNQVDDGAITGSNMVVNGAMTVAQRGASATISSAVSYYATIDRFAAKYFGSSWSVSNHSRQEQVTDAPDGFLHSGKYTALIAQDYSNALGSWVQYTFENQDITSLQNGSGLKDFTISLWLKSNKTGNVTLSVEGSGYSYSTYVTIDTASTWEYKTVTFPATNLAVGIDYTGDPTGGNFNFKVGLGSNGSWVVDTDDQWNDKTSNRGVLSSQQTNFQAAVNDYLQITGVCLNVGDSAIDFPHESYGDTLAKCQRYYQQYDYTAQYANVFTPTFNINSTQVRGTFQFAAEMRAAPTYTTNGAGNFRINNNTSDEVCAAVGSQGTTTHGTTLTFDKTTSNLSNGGISYVNTENTNDASLRFDTEL
jgi:hypothetical protein